MKVSIQVKGVKQAIPAEEIEINGVKLSNFLDNYQALEKEVSNLKTMVEKNYQTTVDGLKELASAVDTNSKAIVKIAGGN